MASEWPTVTFQQLINEGLLEIGDGYRAQNSELGGTGPIFLRAGHVTDTHIDFDGVERFHQHLTDRVGPKMTMPGDTIVTTKGNSTGRTSFVTDRIPPFVYSPHLSYWRSRNPKRLEGGFLRYWSRGVEFTQQLSGMKASTDMAPYLSLTDQRRLEITLPPLPEQKAIGQILGALDDKIELNRRMNATLEAMARALFQSWFVDFDPVRAKLDGRQPVGLDSATTALFPAHFQDSPLGPIPLGWNVKAISDVSFRVTKGDTPRSDAIQAAPRNDRMVPMLRVNAISEDGEVLLDKLEFIPESIHIGKSKRSILEENDILYTNAGTIGRVALVRHWLLPANTNQAIAIIRPDPARVPPTFLYMAMRQPEFQTMLHHDIVHAVQANLALGKISNAQAVFPPAGTITQLSEPLIRLQRRVFQNRRESRILATLRDTLLPKLLSGELRVADAKVFAEKASA